MKELKLKIKRGHYNLFKELTDKQAGELVKGMFLVIQRRKNRLVDGHVQHRFAQHSASFLAAYLPPRKMRKRAERRFVLQSFSQLNAKYGKDIGDIIKTNCNKFVP